MKDKTKTYLNLFASAFYISAVTFGSGIVIVSVIKRRFVDELHWIEEEEMLNLIALAQSTPGVVTCNTALLVGYKVCGVMGAFLSVLGVALPPLITISIIASFYDALRANAVVSAVLNGMQAGACAVIVDVVTDLFAGVVKGEGLHPALKAAIMIGTFIAAYLLKVNYIFIILFLIILGVGLYFLDKRRAKDASA